MALKNFTTTKPVTDTVAEIHKILANHKAKKVMFDYFDDGRMESICFQIATPTGDMGVRLPANSAAVQRVLTEQKKTGKSKTTIDNSPEQAERVAWRIVKDWLDSQLAILETEMVDVRQVFFPYLLDNNGNTLYELFEKGQLALPGVVAPENNKSADNDVIIL
jgi:hypothetical protein